MPEPVPMVTEPKVEHSPPTTDDTLELDNRKGRAAANRKRNHPNAPAQRRARNASTSTLTQGPQVYAQVQAAPTFGGSDPRSVPASHYAGPLSNGLGSQGPLYSQTAPIQQAWQPVLQVPRRSPSQVPRAIARYPAGSYPVDYHPAQGLPTGADLSRSHSSGGYPDGVYLTGGLPPRGDPDGGYLTGGFPTRGDPDGGYLTGGHPSRGHPNGDYLSGGCPTGGYSTGGNLNGGNPSGGFPIGGYPTGGYTTGGYLTGGHPTAGFNSGGYTTGGYANGTYTTGFHPNRGHAAGSAHTMRPGTYS